MAELTPDIRDQINQSNSGLKVTQDQGVIIVNVQNNSPAARGGLRPGDIIQSINGTGISTSQQVQQQVESVNLGSTMEIAVNRNGQTQKVRIKPEPLPARENPS